MTAALAPAAFAPPAAVGARELVPGFFGKMYGAPEGRRFLGLHGWSGDHRTFAPLQSYLPDDVSLLAVDQPGFGRSARPARWDFDTFTDPILRAMDAQGWPSCTIVGNCAGAVVALELAMRAPERIDRLVLIDPFAYVPWYFRLLSWGWPGWFFYNVTFANPLGRWMTNRALASKRTDDSDLSAGFVSIQHDVAFRYLRLLCESGDAKRYSRVSAPVSLLYGAKTFAAVRRSVHIYRGIWRQAEAHEVAGAGHLPIQEAPSLLSSLTFGKGGSKWTQDEQRFIPCASSRSSPA